MHIGREAGVAGAQCGELVAPFVQGLRESVDKHDGFAGALLEVVHADIGGLSEA